MQQVYSNVSKVMIDSRSNSNLLYLPLDKLMQQSGAPAAGTTIVPTPAQQAQSATPESTGTASVDVRSRDGGRSRERDGR